MCERCGERCEGEMYGRDVWKRCVRDVGERCGERCGGQMCGRDVWERDVREPLILL